MTVGSKFSKSESMPIFKKNILIKFFEAVTLHKWVSKCAELKEQYIFINIFLFVYNNILHRKSHVHVQKYE